MGDWRTYPLAQQPCAAKQPTSGRLKHSGGFTLIELMLAVTIAGILSSLAIPTYVDFLEKARVARSIAELHMLATEIKAFAISSEQYPDTLTQIGQSTLLDPWGNQYQYLRIECGTVIIGRLPTPDSPASGSAGLVIPVNGFPLPNQAHISFAVDEGGHQGLIHRIAKGGGGGGGPGCGGGKPRKDHFLHPISSDFDLYSMGKDGETVAPLTAQKSHDDVIRASDGAFYGLAANF